MYKGFMSENTDVIQIVDTTSEKIQVLSIEWERVFLKIAVKVDGVTPKSFQICKYSRKKAKQPDSTEKVTMTKLHKRIPIKVDHIDGDIYHFVLNITCLDETSFLDNGYWLLLAEIDEENCLIASVSNQFAYELEYCDRIYHYGGNLYAYTMSFSTYSDERMILSLVINSRFFIENKKWRRRRYVEEAKSFKRKRKNAIKSCKFRMMRLYCKIVGKLTPKNGSRVMFMSETKDFINGNLKYINDRIKERGLDKELKLTYSFQVAVGKKTGFLSRLKLLTKIGRQDYIFVDDFVPLFGFLDLDKRTKLIQVWHAGEGFKAVGYCRFGKKGTPFPIEHCHKKYDYVITGSKHLVTIFEEVFALPEERFLPLGMARLDGFLDSKKIETFREQFYTEYPKLKEKKIILFAPTFRGTGQKTAHYDYDQLDYHQIYEFCGDKYIWAFKMHPFIKQAPIIPEEYADRMIDLSEYKNINDLYYITDLLITDYSSNYFEYALMKKPVLFFTYDREKYELIRGVHRSVKESAPGKVCDSFEEMMTALKHKDFEVEKIYQFVEDNFKEYDGKASDKAIDQIILKKNKDL